MRRLPLNPKDVIFDMDGVVTDTMLYHVKAWKKAFNTFGIKVNRYEIYLREGQKGLQTAIELMQENGFKASMAKAKDILRLKEEIFRKIARYKLIKGSKQLIRDLRKNNLLIVVGKRGKTFLYDLNFA